MCDERVLRDVPIGVEILRKNDIGFICSKEAWATTYAAPVGW
ncbi:hypothetical protein [Serratia fonticola]